MTVLTPGRRVSYEGTTAIDGVAGTAAPIRLEFLDASGSLVDRQMLPPASGVARTAQVSVAHLPAGIYALRAFSGEKLIATRVITVVR